MCVDGETREGSLSYGALTVTGSFIGIREQLSLSKPCLILPSLYDALPLSAERPEWQAVVCFTRGSLTQLAGGGDVNTKLQR